jgi:hypothetical protein
MEKDKKENVENRGVTNCIIHMLCYRLYFRYFSFLSFPIIPFNNVLLCFFYHRRWSVSFSLKKQFLEGSVILRNDRYFGRIRNFAVTRQYWTFWNSVSMTAIRKLRNVSKLTKFHTYIIIIIWAGQKYTFEGKFYSFVFHSLTGMNHHSIFFLSLFLFYRNRVGFCLRYRYILFCLSFFFHKRGWVRVRTHAVPRAQLK